MTDLYVQPDCDCRINSLRMIAYCPRHAAADAMYEALKRALDNKYLWQIEAQAALAKAEGDDDA